MRIGQHLAGVLAGAAGNSVMSMMRMPDRALYMVALRMDGMG
jgi:hypothetical protein